MNSVSAETKMNAGSFQSTRWTLVLAASGEESTPSQSYEALSELCRIYWRPVYLFLRREGQSPSDAQDLTQGFFADFIATRSYARADREKGRFRSYLLGSLKHFVSDDRAREHTQKRGGGKIRETFDDAAIAEVENQMARNHQWDTHQVYDRAWAEALLRQALCRLGEEYALAGKTMLFEALKSNLSPGGEEPVSYQEISARLARSAVTLRKDMERLRARYGQILREEVRGTVSDPAQVDDELRYLCQTVAAM
jgi:RNA polymerase sigma factor (sigma-70 family)